MRTDSEELETVLYMRDRGLLLEEGQIALCKEPKDNGFDLHYIHFQSSLTPLMDCMGVLNFSEFFLNFLNFIARSFVSRPDP